LTKSQQHHGRKLVLSSGFQRPEVVASTKSCKRS